MKKIFFIGENNDHKIAVHFGFAGKEMIYVNDVLVHEKRSLSMKESINFKAGDHDVKIDMASNLKEWTCQVFVDGSLYIQELFDEELMKHKKRVAFFPKYIKFLIIVVVVVLLFAFLKGFYSGLTG
jgi:hypothetical protein